MLRGRCVTIHGQDVLIELCQLITNGERGCVGVDVTLPYQYFQEGNAVAMHLVSNLNQIVIVKIIDNILSLCIESSGDSVIWCCCPAPFGSEYQGMSICNDGLEKNVL